MDSKPVALPSQQHETGWLIEHYDHTPRHVWVRVVRASPTKAEITWTEDSAIALRFARECDAVNFAMLFPQEFTLAKITEHVWSRHYHEPANSVSLETGSRFSRLVDSLLQEMLRATPVETASPDECQRCHKTMLTRDGEEPTEICDHCAHEKVSELESQLTQVRSQLDEARRELQIVSKMHDRLQDYIGKES